MRPAQRGVATADGELVRWGDARERFDAWLRRVSNDAATGAQWEFGDPLPDRLGALAGVDELRAYLVTATCEWERPDCREPAIGAWLLTYPMQLAISWAYCLEHLPCGPLDRFEPHPAGRWDWIDRPEPAPRRES